ncbi:Mitochondrial carrier-like protein 2 [Armadillidium nasatum]|uniref:Mitochondrial carrier-like protein 2 n=1 Tax=Armadillidium nasatum TaxID=96803 RepID=A0A5N5T4R2_9CRUS|nr:Mitochondrial carrier-like protein 2 [Armadillidium nasatum]
MSGNREESPMTWMHVLVRVGLNAVTHPVEYVKVLIQIGHEPMEPYKSRTIFGREKMFYPSVFSYIAHIKKRDGLIGCYRGLTPKLMSNVVSGLTFQRVVENIKFPELDDPCMKPEDLTTHQKTQVFIQNTLRETAGRIAAITASQPFHVIAIRCMAEFVGEDGKYTGIISSITVIYKEEGIKGYFSGLVPRLLCDIGALWLANSFIHIINNFVVEDKDIKSYIAASMRFMASAIMYPLQVVANCMAATGSGLVGCSPPLMPLYDNWYDCYKHLRQIKGLKRGSSLLWRTYTGPQIMLDGGVSLPSQSMFRNPSKKL